MKRWILAVLGMVALQAAATSISQDTAVERALSWMSGNPVMSKASQSVGSIETFPGIGTNYSVYVVQLEPTGYLILNSDDRLPLLVSFSADSSVDMTEHPQNALRSMLINYCERMTEELASQVRVSLGMTTMAEEEDELYGPFLETSWNQNNPYNLFCQDDPFGSQYYDYRVAVGCVPAAFAQVLNFHRWPYHGQGSHSYTDSDGSITGLHSVVFSDPYDWAAMQNSYDPWNTAPASSKDAVAELMYELGVATEASYESADTGASDYELGNQVGEYFFFEPIEYQSSANDLIAPMEADLRAGFPCVVSIPGHTVVADGLMVDAGTTTYHINYGWGGNNNGWFAAADVPNGALSGGVTSLRPRLMAFPQTNAVSGSTEDYVELEWILPKRRTNEVDRLEIRQLVPQTGTWGSDASEISGVNSEWKVASAGRSGHCWYVEKSGLALLALDEVFAPDASSQLTFWQCARLYISVFSVEVTTDDWASYDTLYSTPGSGTDQIYEYGWSQHAISLAAYAGKEIKLRFSVSSGGYFGGDWAGVRIDDLAISGGDWFDWEPLVEDAALSARGSSEVTSSELEGQPVYYSSLTNLSAGTYTLAAVVTDAEAVAHALGPSFTLTVSENVDDGDGMPSDWEIQYGLAPNIDDGELDSDGDGFSNYQEYICGTEPNNAASCLLMEPGTGALPAFQALEERRYAIDFCDNLGSNVWKTLISNLPGSNGTVNVSDYESITNISRFYRVRVQRMD